MRVKQSIPIRIVAGGKKREKREEVGKCPVRSESLDYRREGKGGKRGRKKRDARTRKGERVAILSEGVRKGKKERSLISCTARAGREREGGRE